MCPSGSSTPHLSHYIDLPIPLPLSSSAADQYLDCHGVITPSSGPPINTRFFKRVKLFLYTETR